MGDRHDRRLGVEGSNDDRVGVLPKQERPQFPACWRVLDAWCTPRKTPDLTEFVLEREEKHPTEGLPLPLQVLDGISQLDRSLVENAQAQP